MEMMIPEGHGERRVFEDILERGDLVGGDEGDDIKAGVAVERQKLRLDRHNR